MCVLCVPDVVSITSGVDRLQRRFSRAAVRELGRVFFSFLEVVGS